MTLYIITVLQPASAPILLYHIFAARNLNAVCAYLKSKQKLPFGFAEQIYSLYVLL